jgi:small subunit ribosomal protein S17
MAETAIQKSATPPTEHVQGRRKEVVGEVVANRMQKTIVVKVTRKKAHPFYGRVVARNKKFYAHDEKNEAHVGDVVRIEETRPLSKLKRWKLKDIVRKTTLVPEVALDRDDKGQAKSQSKGLGKGKGKGK